MRPWTPETFPKDRLVYIRRKGSPHPGGSLVVTFGEQGVNVVGPSETGSCAVTTGIKWAVLALFYEHLNTVGYTLPCGTDEAGG